MRDAQRHARATGSHLELLRRIEANAPLWSAQGVLLDATLRMLVQQSPDLAGAAFVQPDAAGHLSVVATFGRAAGYFDDLTRSSHWPDRAFGGGGGEAAQHNASSTLRAWGSGRIATVSTLPNALLALGRSRGVLSTAAIPLHTRGNVPCGVVSLLGARRGQFEPEEMQLWLRALQQLLQQYMVSSRDAASAAFRSNEQRTHYLQALYGDGLRMYMQPVVDLVSGRIVKVEALARLDVDGEIVGPAQFLPVCTELDLAWLFREGLVQGLGWLTRWSESGAVLGLSINLPPSVLVLPECVDWIAAALGKSGVPAHRLTLELLESEENNDLAARNRSIAALSSLGVELALDDLGAGYGSLQRLQVLPFHLVKIDQFPVRTAAQAPGRSVPFLGALVRMAQGMGTRVVVEGLESVELIEMAAALGADWGQGYAIARPMPPEDVPHWIRSWHWDIDPAHPCTALGRRARAFSLDALSLDWKRAIDSHEQWKAAFERRQASGRPLDWQLICRDDKCHLGRWLHQHRDHFAGARRELFDDVLSAHAEFHHALGDAVRNAQEHGADTAPTLAWDSAALEQYSRRLTLLLQRLGAPGGIDDAQFPGDDARSARRDEREHTVVRFERA